jgi:hypothetical protein
LVQRAKFPAHRKPITATFSSGRNSVRCNILAVAKNCVDSADAKPNRGGSIHAYEEACNKDRKGSAPPGSRQNRHAAAGAADPRQAEEAAQAQKTSNGL